MKTGIVILNYNDAELSAKLADGISGYEQLNNIVIVDNASNDGSYETLRAKYADCDNITVISSGKNGGYSYGNNFGARYLIQNFHTDIIIIANPDVSFEENLIRNIEETFRKHPEYGVLTGVMIRPDGSVDPFSYREFFSFAHDLGDCFLTVRRLVYEKMRYEIDYSVSIQTVNVIQGSFFAITAEAYEKIGGLDENVFLYYEELILGKRLKAAGYLTGVLTGDTFLHDHSVSVKKSMKNLKIWRNVLKSKHYYEKYYNNANIFQMALLHICGMFSIIEKFFVEVLRKLL